MGNPLHRIKTGLYIFVIALVSVLFAVRVHNALQKTAYLTQSIVDGGDVQISLSYPAKILSPKNETSYPLTISFVNQGDLLPVHTYEIIFESPTLLFTNSKGVEASSRLQISSDYAFLEKNIYVRPFLAETYPSINRISAKVLVDGQELKAQPDSIEIKTESLWLSYLSLIAASLLEISIASALVTWIANALDTAQNSRKELISQRWAEVQGFAPLPVLERMRKVIDLEIRSGEEHWDQGLVEEFQRIRKSLSESAIEREFFQAVGECLQQQKVNELADLERLYNRSFGQQEKNHKDGISALAKILGIAESDESLFQLITELMKLWDDFDIDAKDVIVNALAKLAERHNCSRLSKSKLEKKVFNNPNRRRLLRSEEIRGLFPQLVPPPANYKALWQQTQKCRSDQKILEWLKQYNLVTNPFGCDFGLYPFYPQRVVLPDQWVSFVTSSPFIASCPVTEDVHPLAVLLRDECLSKRRIFPILVFPQQEGTDQSPLIPLAHAATQTWLDILPLSPDAFLDLPLVSQQALLELLCWSVGAKDMLINLLQQKILKNDVAGSILKRKIIEFQPHVSSAHLPQDHVLLSWLSLRPPDLDYTFLILPLGGNLSPLAFTWCEYFRPFIPTLLQNKIVTKVVTSTPVSLSLSLPAVQLSWSDGQLKKTLDSQFDFAMDKEAQEVMGIVTSFHELFGLGATEEKTIEKLISASHHSLACLLMLGNQLLQKHCGKQEVPEMYLSPNELGDILKTE